jgi:hypothetical protein
MRGTDGSIGSSFAVDQNRLWAVPKEFYNLVDLVDRHRVTRR